MWPIWTSNLVIHCCLKLLSGLNKTILGSTYLQFSGRWWTFKILLYHHDTLTAALITQDSRLFISPSDVSLCNFICWRNLEQYCRSLVTCRELKTGSLSCYSWCLKGSLSALWRLKSVVAWGDLSAVTGVVFLLSTACLSFIRLCAPAENKCTQTPFNDRPLSQASSHMLHRHTLASDVAQPGFLLIVFPWKHPLSSAEPLIWAGTAALTCIRTGRWVSAFHVFIKSCWLMITKSRFIHYTL